MPNAFTWRNNVSKSITQAMSKEIKLQVQWLLGRGKLMFQCPLTEDEIREAWRATFPQETLAAMSRLKNDGYRTDVFMTSAVDTHVVLDGDRVYQVHFEQKLRDRPGYRTRDGRNHFQESWPLGTDKWNKFAQWVGHVGQLDYEFNTCSLVIHNLFEMCGTTGQLVRALPELASVMPDKIKDELRAAKRASGMPYDWAAYDKTRVEVAQNALVKAFLLPSNGHREWDAYALTWASKVAA